MNLFGGQSVLLLNMPLPLAKFWPEGRGCSKILHGYNKSSVSSQPSLLNDNQSLEPKSQQELIYGSPVYGDVYDVYLRDCNNNCNGLKK